MLRDRQLQFSPASSFYHFTSCLSISKPVGQSPRNRESTLRAGRHVDWFPFWNRPVRRVLRSFRSNLRSVAEHPEVIVEYLASEVARDHVTGPFAYSPFLNHHCSFFGVIPKKGQPGKWRLILDLLSPNQCNVNDGIPKDQFSLHYIAIDNAIAMLLEFQPGALMAKFDVESVYRNIAIQPRHQFLLGMSWPNQFFVDLALPFGLRSVSCIFYGRMDTSEQLLHLIPFVLPG